MNYPIEPDRGVPRFELLQTADAASLDGADHESYEGSTEVSVEFVNSPDDFRVRVMSP